MTEKPEFYTWNNTQDPTTNPASELVAFADCELIGINSSMMLVINRQNGNQQIIMPQVVEGLKTCTTFNTIEAHAAHLANTRAELQGNPEMASTALHTLHKSGMLQNATSTCAKLSQNIPRQLPPTRVFIVTCDRPAAVERLLDSLLRTTKLSQHNALFLVDDSREQANRDANREAVAKFNLRSAKEMSYVGADAQQALLAGLTAQLPTYSEGIRFLLDQSQWQGAKTYGRSRTLCLLLSVGYRALIMDDDILCQAILPPITEPGVGIGSGGMRKAAFYASEQELFNSGSLASFDPLSGHASLLGSTLGHALLATNNGPLQESQLLHLNAALANVLQADSPILVTQCGSMGDPGTGGPNWGMFLGEDSIERLLAAPHGISAALENRLNWLGSARPNFFKMPFMSQLTGLDNSYLLPPYFPAFRGEDALFGAMTVAIHHHSVSLEYPWSVPHLPIENRVYSLQDRSLVSADMTLFARYLTENIDYRDSNDAQRNLQLIVQDLLRTSARSDQNLLLDYRAELARGHAHSLAILQRQYAATQKYQSVEFETYLRGRIEDMQKVISENQSPTGFLSDPATATEQQVLTRFRNMAQGYAAALSGWVEIRQVASELSEEMIGSKTMLPV
ncbi:MAG: hypothetical protein R3E64_08675 [Halioglobus sp.]